MCMKVFYKDDETAYNSLEIPARKLGEAFQKVNFLRDLKADYIDRGRKYFQSIDFNNFTIEDKRRVETEIKSNFDAALQGIKKLKPDVRLGVLLAYLFYKSLLKKIERSTPENILKTRFSVSLPKKGVLLVEALFRHYTGWFG